MSVPPAPALRFEPFPLTDQQHAYLVGRTDAFELGNVSTHAYYEYDGDLDIDRFNRAWQRAIDRHDMLRAVIDAEREQQRVLQTVPPFTAQIADLRGLDESAVTTHLTQTRERMSHEVRPAGQYPVFGVLVSRLSDTRTRVHVSFDGLTLDYLSWQLLVADLTGFYADPDAATEPLELTFRDYVLAESASRDSAAYRRAQEYWTARVSELPSAPRLPHAADPATLRRPRWTSRADTLAAEQWTALKLRAAQAGLTPTALVLAAFAEVLATWSESSRFTLNVPRMNRQPLHPQANDILGEFASFSLLAVDHRGDETFTERAKRVQRQLWQDLAHQHFPGVRVLRELIRAGGGFHGAQMPVVLTSTLGFSAGERPLLGEQLERVFALSQTPQVYLDVQIEEQSGSLVYNWDSVEAIFPPGLIDEMAAAFGALLGALATDESTWDNRDLALVPSGHHTRGGIAGPVRDIPDCLVQDLFEQQAAVRPEQPAVVSSGRTLTYAELHRRATQVGHWLRDNDAAAGQPVAIVMAKGWEQPVAAYGALFAGSPYVPIDAALPPARIGRLLDQVGARLVLTQAALADAFDVGDRRVLRVDDGTADSLPVTALPATQTPDDLAYVLFTSGSTGRPKGVMIEHRGMVNSLRATIDAFDIGPDDRCLAVTALHHDMSTFDVFGVLGAGGTIVVPDADRARDAGHWAELIAAHGVTVWNSVPAMMEMLLEHLGEPSAPLRLAFLGGDWIALHVARALAGRLRLVSVGGPTETTLWNIWYPVERVEESWRSVPYGAPVANTRYYVLDDYLRDRPEGVTGEMYCAGPGLARGYWDDPERTAQSFVRHPGTGERIYRTGDLGRCLAGGVLEFVGRADTQVKIRGQRIELGEVEAALAALPTVQGAVVTAVPYGDRPGYRALAGHVTSAGGRRLEPEELTAALRAQLPAHLVPATITGLAAFPLTANGKVDRAALAAGVRADHAAADGPGSASTALEEVIAEVWADVLGVERVGGHDDFFALGGDSVLATRIVVRLRDALDTPDLPVMSLFTTVTVAELAVAMTAADESPERLEQVARIYQQIARMSAEDVEVELRNR